MDTISSLISVDSTHIVTLHSIYIEITHRL